LTKNPVVFAMFMAEIREKSRVEDALVLLDGAPWLKATCHQYGLRFRHETHGNRNSVERVLREVKRRTDQWKSLQPSRCYNRRNMVASARLRMKSANLNTAAMLSR
jgi:transposase-like protein